MATFPDSDQTVASAACYLIDGGEELAANVLLACTVDQYQLPGHTVGPDHRHYKSLIAEVRGPRAAYEILSDPEHPITESITNALRALVTGNFLLLRLDVGVELLNLDPNWKTELLEIARGYRVSNQGPNHEAPRTWQNLKFRSQSEVRIAQALDRAGVLFLPNCRAQLGSGRDRQNREADFLVCHRGEVGILEVDGEPFHPPSRTVQDHERDRMFKAHGISVVEHSDASACYDNPDDIVQAFLKIIERAYAPQKRAAAEFRIPPLGQTITASAAATPARPPRRLRASASLPDDLLRCCVAPERRGRRDHGDRG